jgi:hypothetical protein
LESIGHLLEGVQHFSALEKTKISSFLGRNRVLGELTREYSKILSRLDSLQRCLGLAANPGFFL